MKTFKVLSAAVLAVMSFVTTVLCMRDAVEAAKEMQNERK